MGIGCRIVREIDRAPAQVVEMFRQIPVSNLDDCMGRMAAVHQAIHDKVQGIPLVGDAVDAAQKAGYLGHLAGLFKKKK